jgi:hypothetical protein
MRMVACLVYPIEPPSCHSATSQRDGLALPPASGDLPPGDQPEASDGLPLPLPLPFSSLPLSCLSVASGGLWPTQTTSQPAKASQRQS